MLQSIEEQALCKALQTGHGVVTAAHVLLCLIDLHEQLSSDGRKLPDGRPMEPGRPDPGRARPAPGAGGMGGGGTGGARAERR